MRVNPVEIGNGAAQDIRRRVRHARRRNGLAHAGARVFAVRGGALAGMLRNPARGKLRQHRVATCHGRVNGRADVGHIERATRPCLPHRPVVMGGDALQHDAEAVAELPRHLNLEGCGPDAPPDRGDDG